MGGDWVEVCVPGGPDGEALVLVAAAVSIQMAQGRSDDELALLAAFFTSLGDNLALIVARRLDAAALQERCKALCETRRRQEEDCPAGEKRVK